MDTQATCVLTSGTPQQELVDAYGAVMEAQDDTLSPLQPGAGCAEAFASDVHLLSHELRDRLCPDLSGADGEVGPSPVRACRENGAKMLCVSLSYVKDSMPHLACCAGTVAGVVIDR